MSLMLRRSMSSRIPFKTGHPIVNIPPMLTTTKCLVFENEESKTAYVSMVNNYADIRHQCGVASTETTANLNAKNFAPRWRFTRLVSLSPMLGPVSFNNDFRGAHLWVEEGKGKLLSICQEFIKCSEIKNPWLPSKGQDVRKMNDERLLCALEWAAPKLGRLRDRLTSLVAEGKRVLIWVYWPLSQWFVTEVLLALALHDNFCS